MISKKKKQLLLEYKNYKCEICKMKCKDLEIHRINRGLSYEDFRNLKVLCKGCHKKIHQCEFPHISK